MTGFGEILQERKDAIVRRWLEAVLAAYPEESADAFARGTDPFANPIGYGLREGTERIFQALLDGMDTDEITGHLLPIVRVRAVQQFPPSVSVGFVFLLKRAVQVQLGTVMTDPRFAADRAEFEERIDRLALAAFDVFVQCREQVFDLRVNELKRQIPWAVSRMNRGEKRENGESELVQVSCERQET